MASVRDPTAAFHILRLMGGGLRGAAKRRPWQARLPGTCHGCGHAVLAICWTTRTQTHQGLGWCDTGLDPDDLPPDLWMAAITDEEAANPSIARGGAVWLSPAQRWTYLRLRGHLRLARCASGGRLAPSTS